MSVKAARKLADIERSMVIKWAEQAQEAVDTGLRAVDIVLAGQVADTGSVEAVGATAVQEVAVE